MEEQQQAQAAAQGSQHPVVERFPMHATSAQPNLVENYFRNRAVQLLSTGRTPPSPLPQK